MTAMFHSSHFFHTPRATGDMHDTLGAVQLGNMIQCVLLGMLTTQTYQYFGEFKGDSRWLKAMVATVWICELASSASIDRAVYGLLVVGPGESLAAKKPPTSLFLGFVFSGISTGIVQGFLAWRVYKFSRSWILPSACWILALYGFVANIVAFSTAWATINGDLLFSSWLLIYRWLLLSLLVAGLITDIAIAAALTISLSRSKSSDATWSVAVIDKLMIWTLQTGILTSVLGAAVMILFLVSPIQWYWMAIFIFLSKVYSISFIAILHGRSTLREMSTPAVKGLEDALGSVNPKMRHSTAGDLVNFEMAGSSTSRENLEMKVQPRRFP
ncbi:hypothetical protein DL96DRAFT_1611625 [Flagelloscypha sp. PMI_526]|nr:hypothetical protein DL96DRAFT_1611625 [Flagelloscypha sp. PMI_526]